MAVNIIKIPKKIIVKEISENLFEYNNDDIMLQFYRDIFTRIGCEVSLIYLETKIINNNKILLKFEKDSYIIEPELNIKFPFQYIAISAEKIINNIIDYILIGDFLYKNNNKKWQIIG